MKIFIEACRQGRYNVYKAVSPLRLPASTIMVLSVVTKCERNQYSFYGIPVSFSFGPLRLAQPSCVLLASDARLVRCDQLSHRGSDDESDVVCRAL